MHQGYPLSGRALGFAPGPPFATCFRCFGFCIALLIRSSEHYLRSTLPFAYLRITFELPSPSCLSTDCHLHMPPCTELLSPSECTQCSDGPSKLRPSPDPPPSGGGAALGLEKSPGPGPASASAPPEAPPPPPRGISGGSRSLCDPSTAAPRVEVRRGKESLGL